MKKIDLEEFYSEFFDEVDGKTNLPCPFPDRHKAGEDKLPSFRVFLDTGGTFCHGCNYKSTTPINFWADVNKVPFEKALRRFYNKYVEKLVPPSAYQEPAEKLLSNPIVLKRLSEFRGITEQTARRFRLGYDGKRLTIPVFSEEGWCMNVRRYDLFKVGGPKMVSYAEGFGKARLFPLESMRAKSVVVVEGELDAILGCQNGLSCVSPSGGATAWDEKWGALFKDKKVFVVPDNDDPGMKGAKLRAGNIAKFAASCKIISLPVKEPGEDLTDWFLKYKGTAEEFRELCRETKDGKAESAPDVRKPVNDVLDGIEGAAKSKTEEAMIVRAEAIWNDLVACGAFFKTANNELFYAREGLAAMHVSSGLGAFMSFLSSRSPLINQATSTGKFIYNHILNKAFSQSELSKTGCWTMYDGGRLFIHAGKDILMKMGDGKPHHIKNAINEERILLELPVQSMAVPEMPSSSPSEGLDLMRSLFMDNLAMQEEDRYLLVCWLSSIFFRDYVKPKPIVRLLAKTASGKSTSSKLVSVMLYGEELLSHSASTVAATYEMSSKYPLLILDNLETRNMTPQLEDFLLVAATGGMKAKRQLSTDSGLVLQHTNSLVLTNGIEPFSRHELIDRTMEIDLDLDKYGSREYQEAKVFAALKLARPKIMSAILFMVHKYVLPRIKKGEISRIMKEFGQHGKERFNEYLAVMCIMLDAYWGYMPLKTYRRPHDLVNFWLDSQTHAEQRQDEGTNDVLYFLSTFVDRYEQMMGATVKVVKSEGEAFLKCTTRELLSDFRVMAKYLGMRCPWINERQLGTRIADSEDILNRAGWFRVSKVANGRAYYEYKYVSKERRRLERRKGEWHGERSEAAVLQGFVRRDSAGRRAAGRGLQQGRDRPEGLLEHERY